MGTMTIAGKVISENVVSFQLEDMVMDLANSVKATPTTEIKGVTPTTEIKGVTLTTEIKGVTPTTEIKDATSTTDVSYTNLTLPKQLEV